MLPSHGRNSLGMLNSCNVVASINIHESRTTAFRALDGKAFPHPQNRCGGLGGGVVFWKKSDANRNEGITIFGQATTTTLSSMRTLSEL
jgi:hypothetical protein